MIFKLLLLSQHFNSQIKNSWASKLIMIKLAMILLNKYFWKFPVSGYNLLVIFFLPSAQISVLIFSILPGNS